MCALDAQQGGADVDHTVPVLQRSLPVEGARRLPDAQRRRAVQARVCRRGRLLQAVPGCQGRRRAQAGGAQGERAQVLPHRPRVQRARRARLGAHKVVAGAPRARVRPRPDRLRLFDAHDARGRRRRGRVRQGVVRVRRGHLHLAMGAQEGLWLWGVCRRLQRPARRAPVRVRRQGHGPLRRRARGDHRLFQVRAERGHATRAPVDAHRHGDAGAHGDAARDLRAALHRRAQAL